MVCGQERNNMNRIYCGLSDGRLAIIEVQF